ncbi:MAG: M1 family metallopeptidase [Deferrisomatales bacterium]
MTRVAPDPYRLPTSAVPTHYDLTLEPDLDGGSFSGQAAIRLEVREPLDALVLNAKELELREARLDGEAVAGVSLDPERERATFAAPGRLEPGEHTLEVAFRGALNEKLAGFYRSTFTDEAGRRHAIATTQLQSTDARRAFPCFDEPAFKATFSVTLVVPEHLAAVSNAPVLAEDPAGTGRKRVRFARTMPMSTYLVAFVVGPFEATEAVDVDGVPLRVVHTPGKGRLARYALEAGAHALRFLTGYYGIPYPGEKLDMVAVPDFAFGAMENLGCITYREVLLLVDEERATQAELLRVADVISHEIAHMWFGDLVTMRWWNGIWLNEAFATFMATACTDAFRPEWGRWDQFSRERSAAFDVDSLASTRPIEYEVRSPADADGMFDLLTYEKGASVVRMLEQYLGPQRFRDGIRHYLAKHAYGNTETGDLWEALEEVTGAPARRIMDSWIFQGGYPLISASRGATGGLALRQSRFYYTTPAQADTARWSVPLVLRRLGDAPPAGGELRRLLEGVEVRLGQEETGGPVLVNAGGYGFYRVRYDQVLLEEIVDRMMEDLAPIERYVLADDAWAAVLAGAATAPEFLSFAGRFVPETDLDVWAVLAGSLANLERLLDGEALARYRKRAGSLLRPALERLGWEPRPGDPPRSRELRALLWRALAVTVADPEALERGRRLHEAYLADPASVEPNLAAAAAAAVASHGTPEDYEVFLARFRSPADPQEERRYRSLLAAFPGPEEMDRTLAMTLDGTVRTQDAPYLLAECLVNRHQGERAWDFVASNWDRMLREYPDNAIVRMAGGVRALSRPQTAQRVFGFFATHPVPKGRRTMDQNLEKLRVNVALREREAGPLAAWLAGLAG